MFSSTVEDVQTYEEGSFHLFGGYKLAGIIDDTGRVWGRDECRRRRCGRLVAARKSVVDAVPMCRRKDLLQMVFLKEQRK